MTEPGGAEIRRGWPVIAASFAGIMTGIYALPFYIIGPLAGPLHADLGWDRLSILTVTSFLNLGQFIGTPIAGRLTDRFEPCPIAVFSMALLSLGMAALALRMQTVWMFHAGYFVLGLLCAGSGSVTFTRAIGHSFRRSRGFALGLAMAGTGISAFLAPLLIQILTEHYGWRIAMLCISGLTAMAIPVVFIGLKRPPNMQSVSSNAGAATPNVHIAVTWGPVLRDPRIYLLALIFILLGLFVGGLVLHTMPLLIEQGLSPRQAAATASLNGIALIIGRVLVGWLLDRMSPTLLALMTFLIAATGCAGFVLIGPSAAPLMVVSIGLMIGSEIDLLSFLIVRYFGLHHYGLIYGALFSLYIGVSLTSPWVTAALVRAGGFREMFLAAAATFTVVGLLFLALGRLGPQLAPKTALRYC